MRSILQLIAKELGLVVAEMAAAALAKIGVDNVVVGGIAGSLWLADWY